MPWTYLTVAIIFEVGGTMLLKKSNGLQEMVSGAGAIGFYMISLVFLAFALRAIDVGVAYAIWSALGTALIVIGGMLFFGEQLTPLKLVFVAMIVAGVVGLRFTAGEV